METLHLKNKELNIEYKIYNYNELPNPSKEIKRIEILKLLENKYPDKDIKGLLLNGYSNNLNSKDPFLCSNLENSEINKIIENGIKEIQEIKDIEYKIDIKHNKHNAIFTFNNISLSISKVLLKHILKQIIHKPDISINIILWCLLYRYNNLDMMTGISSSVLPSIYLDLKDKYNIEIEGFGSLFNHTLKYYFGLYYDLEKYFGCLGNFFNSKIKRGKLVINPPFYVEIINKTINHLKYNCNNFDASFILFIPTWDMLDRKILNKVCKDKLKLQTYDEDVITRELLHYKHTLYYYLYCKSSFPYYNFFINKKINYSSTTLILLSSNDKIMKIDIKPDKIIYQK